MLHFSRKLRDDKDSFGKESWVSHSRLTYDFSQQLKKRKLFSTIAKNSTIDDKMNFHVPNS